MFVGIGSDEAGVHLRQRSTTVLEEVPQDVALPEATMAVAREGGMVRNLAVQSQTAEPSIAEVKVDFLAEPPLGSNAHAVSNDQHPDHQLRSNRGTADRAAERLQFRAYALQIEELVDPSKEVLIRDMVIGTVEGKASGLFGQALR